MSTPNETVYYAVVQKDTGLVVNSGHCPRFLAELQVPDGNHEIVITSDPGAVVLGSLRHEEIKSGFVLKASTSGPRIAMSKAYADKLASIGGGGGKGDPGLGGA